MFDSQYRLLFAAIAQLAEHLFCKQNVFESLRRLLGGLMDENFLIEIREEKKRLDAKRVELHKQFNQLGKEMSDLHERCPHDNMMLLTNVDPEDPPAFCPDCGYNG